MLKIRLQRIGRKNDPSYRLVVTEHTRGPKSEKHVDRVGFYNPKTKEQNIDAEKVSHWLSVGAKASGTVHNMLVKAGIIKADTINVLPQKSPVVKEQEESVETEAQATDTTEGADTAATEDAPANSEEAAADTQEQTEEAPADESKEEAGEEETKEEEVENTEEAKEEASEDNEDK